ncbi:MAG: hypothetical protein H0V44_08690, partial [Planctomycetes bacterium]|nr:hypothetical protein [Planctomycetota bacterium]
MRSVSSLVDRLAGRCADLALAAAGSRPGRAIARQWSRRTEHLHSTGLRLGRIAERIGAAPVIGPPSRRLWR